MSYGKEAYIDAFDELVQEYIEKHGDTNEQAAEAYAERNAWERYQNNLADLIDQANDQRKEFRA